MASLRQYFETDFSNTLRVHVTLSTPGREIESILHFDPLAPTAFLSCWADQLPLDELVSLVQSIDPGATQLRLAGRVTLPQIRLFPGDLEVRNEADFSVRFRLFGDSVWRTTKDIPSTGRIFLYVDAELRESDVAELRNATDFGELLQVRARDYQRERAGREEPLAFICHDSRDKDEVARPIAVGLKQLLCPVWYDEFSLGVGANLRDAIEAGIKACRRCILVLSPSFFSNDGWTKKEFDSIFSREIMEGSGIVLPIWHGVSKEEVYEYCPSLVNVKGLDVRELGVEEVVRCLYRAVVHADS